MNNKAFSLLELIIVIAVISIIAAISFVSIDPSKRIGEANDNKRLVESGSIERAIEKYAIDNHGLPQVILELENDIPYMITSEFIGNSLYCSEYGEGISEVVLGTILEDYLSILPVDPKTSDPFTNGTGYYLIKTHNFFTKVKPCYLYDINSPSDSQTSLQCGSILVDNRNNQEYATIEIGTQCWINQGLNIGIRIDGSDSQTDNGIIEKYCYDNNYDNCDTVLNPNYPDGGLYRWNEAMAYTTIEGTQGICPNGWHIPSDNEIKILEMELGMDEDDADLGGWRMTYYEGDKLKNYN